MTRDLLDKVNNPGGVFSSSVLARQFSALRTDDDEEVSLEQQFNIILFVDKNFTCEFLLLFLYGC